MGDSMKQSADYGHRLIPQILDNLASAEPNRILYSIAKSSDISQGFRTVTAGAFTKAVDKTAWLLRRELGENQEIRAVGYIGPHDLRQILLTYACVKANCTALFLSPKNSIEGALAVLEAAKCNIWVNPAGGMPAPLVNDILHDRPMQVINLPELNELLPEVEDEGTEVLEPFPYTKSWDDALNDPFCLLHTSGSTGLPKPLAWSHALIGTMDAVRLLSSHEGMELWTKGWDEGDTIYSSFPMSHGAGILMDMIIPALFGLHCVMGPPDVIPNLELISSLAEHAKIDIWSMIPSLTDELGEAIDILPKLARSKFICASGGPVSPTMASKVNQFVRVLNLTGTSEGLFIGNLWTEREDWHWFAFHPWSGFEFKEIEPGLHEQWIHRNEHADLFQGLFKTFPDVDSFNFKDLYVQHPTKPGLWAYHGRSDDIVVLSNGYKISPLDTEALVATHPAIDGCLMIGSGKTQAGLLIELKDPDIKRDENDALFDSIWAIVERANSLSMHKNQLHRDYIAFSEPGKPFIRTDKRTIKRRATMTLYADYIERFYQSREEGDEEHGEATSLGLLAFDATDLESTTRVVRRILASVVPAVAEAPMDADLFSLGFDSLLVFRAVKAVAVVTDLKGRLVPRNFYAGPTVEKIAATVVRLVADRRAAMNSRNGISSSAEQTQHQLDPQVIKIQELMKRHQIRLSAKLGPMDLLGGNIYDGFNFFLPLRPGVSFEQAYKVLQKGLVRAMELVPDLAGVLIPCSEHEIGYKKGDLRITVPPLPCTALGTSEIDSPRQLRFQDLSAVLPSYAEQRASGFLTSEYRDRLLTTCPNWPSFPADVLYAQANFVEGGCILAFNVHHHSFDGIGVMIAFKVWAECCRFVSSDESADCEWLHPDSLNRDLLSVLYELEGFAKPAEEVDPRVWGFLPFKDPTLLQKKKTNPSKDDVVPSSKTVTNDRDLPEPPQFARTEHWPPKARTDSRSLTSSTFLITAEKLERLQKSVDEPVPEDTDMAASHNQKGGMLNLSDVLQAFFWRATIRARLPPAHSSPDDTAILEMPTDARPYFSSHLPPSYMGNCVIMNRLYMSVADLCSPETPLYKIAQIFRDARNRVNQELVHDAFSLLHMIPDNSPGNHSAAFIGQGVQDGWHTVINNLLLFQTGDMGPFGGDVFEAPEVVRLQMDGLNKAFRVLFIHPMREDGGVELMLGTFPEELDSMMHDRDFTQFAEFMK